MSELFVSPQPPSDPRCGFKPKHCGACGGLIAKGFRCHCGKCHIPALSPPKMHKCIAEPGASSNAFCTKCGEKLADGGVCPKQDTHKPE